MSAASDTLTFLFTDIEGSTRLWEQYPDIMPQALARHDELLRIAIEGNGGQVFKTMGDAFYGVFTQAPSALRAALEAQRGLAVAQWPEIGALRVRMALHSGEAEARDGDYFGAPLNYVARLLSAGHGGQVLLSFTSQEQIRDALPPGIQLRDMGDRRLKDLARPSRVFQLIAPDLPGEFPPLKTLDNHPHNLPEQTTPLIGREKEVIETRDELLAPAIRLLTLTGPGGTGKTRLALQIAAEVLHHFHDGAFFVLLAPLSDPALVGSTIAQTLGIQETAEQKIEQRLQEHLRDKEMLLVLDNFEQIVEASALVSELLSACPKLKVLVTSRIALHLRGEHEFPVPPLALPRRKPPPPLATLSQYAAVQLFIQRAQAVKADFAVTNENAPAVAEICTRLDGLPLAIELAAARSKVLSPQAMLSRLEHRLKLLTGGARDLPQRQQTLRGAIAWSYDLLEPEEKVLFRRLSAFVGGCTLEASEAVCGEELGIDLFDGVCSLVDKSLLKQEEDETGEPRFWILETIREFGLEQLESSGEEMEARRRHAQYFLDLAQGSDMHGSGQAPVMAIKRMALEQDNSRAAMDWCLAHDIEMAARLAFKMTPFWTLTNQPEGLRQTEPLLSRIDGLTIQWQVETLVVVTAFTAYHADYENLHTLSERLLILSRKANDQHGIEFALRQQAKLALKRGDLNSALAYLDESLSLVRRRQRPISTATSLMTVGDTHTFYTRNFIEARRYYEEALNNFEQGKYARGIARVFSRLALLLGHEGAISESRTLYNKAMPILCEYGDKASIAWVHFGLGELAIKENDFASAHKNLTESLHLFSEQGVNDLISDVLVRLAFLDAKADRWIRAARFLGVQEASRNVLRVPGGEPYLEFVSSGAKTALGESTFEAERLAGAAMTLDEAVEYALVGYDKGC